MKLNIFLKVGIVIFWFVAVILFLVRENIIFSRNIIKATKLLKPELICNISSPVGIYFKNEKIGYIFIKTDTTEDTSILQAEGFLKIDMLGYCEDIKFILYSYLNYLTKKINMNLFIESVLQKFTAIAKIINDNRMQLELISEDIRLENQFLLNPIDLQIEEKKRYTLLKYKDFLRLEIHYLSEEKDRLKEIHISPHFRLVFGDKASREERLTALTLPELVNIESNRILKFARKASFVKARLYNISLEDLPEDTTFQYKKDNFVIVDTRNFDKKIKEDFNQKRITNKIFLKKYLESNQYIQSADERIKNKACEISRFETSEIKKIQKIISWMQNNISQEYSFGLPSAINVLKERKGDCSEFAVLFAAFARSLSIPTRICNGIIYSLDAFYYHAWNEVYINGMWVPVDPILGQFPADATHIKLICGDDIKSLFSLDILKYLSRLKNVKVTKYEYSDRGL